MWNRISRLDPTRATESVAVVMAEKRADTFGSKVSDAIFAISRQDDRVRKYGLPLIDATLEVAENVVSARNVVAKVTKGLHNLSPGNRVIAPSTVAVELLIVLDKRLTEYFLPTPLGVALCKAHTSGTLILISMLTTPIWLNLFTISNALSTALMSRVK